MKTKARGQSWRPSFLSWRRNERQYRSRIVPYVHPMNSWIEYEPHFVRRRYNRLASIYVFFEWLFWLPRGIRPRAVERLNLKPGDRVLEVG